MRDIHWYVLMFIACVAVLLLVGLCDSPVAATVKSKSAVRCVEMDVEGVPLAFYACKVPNGDWCYMVRGPYTTRAAGISCEFND